MNQGISKNVTKKPVKKKVEIGFNYKNAKKMNKNFMYKDLKRGHCYDCDFQESNFDFTSFRGARFKSCNFYGVSFKAAEFIGSNLKKIRFKKAKFEDVVFEGVNLEGVDFAGAVFRNTIFVGTDVTKAKNLNTISVMRLQKQFSEKTLLKGLELAKAKIDNDFCTLSYIIKFLARHEAQGLI